VGVLPLLGALAVSLDSPARHGTCDRSRGMVSHGNESGAPSRIRLRRGLDLRIPGAPAGAIEPAASAQRVALLGDDHPGLRPVLAVTAHDRVHLGQTLFTDRRRPEIRWVAPAAGVVRSATLTEARRLHSLVIEVEDGAEREYPRRDEGAIRDLGREGVVQALLEAGLWVALRTRPYGRIPSPAERPHALFVRAIDSEPLSASVAPVVADRPQDFRAGLAALAQLCEAPPFVCVAAGDRPPVDGLGVRVVEFAGPHPAGLVGTHIHHLAPVGEGRTAWYVGYQDVLAVGALLRRGRLDPERVVALGGPAVLRPRCLRTRLGAAIDELVAGELSRGPCRVISGSPLSGRAAAPDEAYLGRYHDQVCALPEPTAHAERRVARWLRAATRWLPPLPRRRRFTTALHGTPGPMLPIERFERVAPLDLHVAALLRALAVGDAERAATLGALELEEEDVALASYVCPGKLDYGPLLRASLDALEAGA